MNQLKWLLRTVVPPLAVFAVIIGLWYWYSLKGLAPDRRFVLPPPHQIFTQGFADAKNRSDILHAFLVTTKEAMLGLLIAVIISTVLALLMAQAKWVERSLYPWIVVIQTIPTLAILPMVGFWFGYSTGPKLLIVVIIAMFPLVMNPLQGMLGVDPGLHDLLSLANASRFTRLMTLQVPWALPDFFVGLRQAAGLSVVGATVGDYFFGQGPIGLGLIISKYTARLDAPPMLAVAFAACALGIVVFLIFGALGRRVVGRWSPAWGAH